MRTFRFLTVLLCTLLLSATANAAVETYDFVVAEEGKQLAPNYGETIITGGNNLQLISTAGNDFNHRFAVGPTGRNNGTNNGFIFRTAGDWKGLWSQYNNRNFSILNLKKGDKVTITISKSAETLKFVGGDVVVSGQEYSVEADGNFDFVTTGGVYIEKVAIDVFEGENEEPSTPEIPSAGYGTFDFVKAAAGTITLPAWGAEVTSGNVALNMLAFGDEAFDNRFAVGPVSRNNASGNCFKFRTAGDWKGLYSQYSDRNFSILNLKAGDTFSIIISKDEQTLKFVDGDVVVSGQEYSVEADGNVDFVTTGSVYIESVTIEKAKPAVTIGEAKFATFGNLSGCNLSVPDGLTAYAAVNGGDKVILRPLDIIPAGAGVIVGGDAGTYSFVETSANSSYEGENCMVAVFEDMIVPQTDGAKTNYIFANKDGNLGFYISSGEGEITKAKAYLSIANVSSAKMLSFGFDHATGIKFVNGIDSSCLNRTMYNLQGQKIQTLINGLYLINGKKIIINNK